MSFCVFLQRRAQSLESIAGELQMKVINLQKEKDALYDQINFMGQNPGKGNHSAALSIARERQENLELKVGKTLTISLMYIVLYKFCYY